MIIVLAITAEAFIVIVSNDWYNLDFILLLDLSYEWIIDHDYCVSNNSRGYNIHCQW